MIAKIKKVLLSAAALSILAAPALLPAAASATGTGANPQDAVCSGSTNLTIPTATNATPAGGDCTYANDNSTSTINNIITTVLNIISVVVGIVAVVMIVIAGFHYVTSGGSDEKVKKAKNTILYAIIGLIIVALAQIIVKFVLNKTVNNGA